MKKMQMMCFVILWVASFGLSVDSNDLLDGDGLFLNQSVSSFDISSSHDCSFLTANSTNVLKVKKPASQSVSFSQGLTYNFSCEEVAHLSFEFASSDPDTEDSNLRLINSNNGKTLILFRAGRGGLIRVNDKQMISFYNESVSNDTSISLTKVDMVVNWTSKEIDVFISDTFKERATFFHDDVSCVNQLFIYNLYQSVSYWTNIVVCTDICYSFSFQSFFVLLWALYFYLFTL